MIEPNAQILIVDGDDARRGDLERMLDRYNHVRAAETGQAALNILGEHRQDVIVIPVSLPDMSGANLLDRIRAGERGSETPVIIMATEDEEPQLAACLSVRSTDALPLPTTRLVFNNRIRAAIHLHAVEKRVDDLLNVVIPIGIQLSAERDFDRLLETILFQAQDLTEADAGTLYLRTDDDTLRFMIVRNKSLDMMMGGTSGQEITFPEVPLTNPETGEPNHANVVAYTVNTRKTVNVPDAYEQVNGFDFSGTKRFDEGSGYHSKSFLTIPLLNGMGEAIGALQLINALDRETGEIISFDHELHPIVESMSGLATVALEASLREDSLRRQIADLRIEIDEKRRKQEVDKITETEYFQKLQKRAKDLRRGRGNTEQ